MTYLLYLLASLRLLAGAFADRRAHLVCTSGMPEDTSSLPVPVTVSFHVDAADDGDEHHEEPR